MGLPGDQIPKGMEIPVPEIPEIETRKPITSADVNYVGRLRELLDSDAELQFIVLELVSHERDGENPIIDVRLSVDRKEETA